MKITEAKLLALGLVFSLLLMNGATNLVRATPTNTDYLTPAQIVEPFEEMLPGVYVASEWWNDSGSWSFSDVESYVYDSPSNQSVGGTNPYVYYYEVYDMYGNVYYIEEESVSDWSDEWAYSNLLVTILLDPDASYMSWLASQGNTSDLWGFYWWPEPDALSGDEVFVYSSFYFSEYNTTGYYESDYTWYDSNWTQVDANDILPIIADDYSWAFQLNGSYRYDYDWQYSGYGYDINEMFLHMNETLWMEHYFAGMNVFNDTNGNGIMDMVYDEVEIDWDEDGIVDYTYTELNETASEYVYEFYSSDGDVGDIVLPHLNDDNQIEWSAEVVDITGNLWSFTPFYCFGGVYYDSTQNSTQIMEDPVVIPVAIENLEMVYRFEVPDDAAVLKIDQHVGDFTNPDTGGTVEEIQGLSLALNYWSSFSSYSLEPYIWDDNFTTIGGDFVEPIAFPESNEAEPAPEGALQFQDDATLRTMVEFGGEYLWGKDGQFYDVGTAVMPTYFSAGPIYDTAPASELSYGQGIWSWQMFYYSSCYSNWDGYAITHDPIFSVFPMQSPGQVSDFITNLLTASVVVGAIGMVALATFCIRYGKIKETA